MHSAHTCTCIQPVVDPGPILPDLTLFPGVTRLDLLAATPILGNMRKLSMRTEALRALEHRKNSVMQERRRKRMETLGAHNDFNKKVGGSRAAGVARRGLIVLVEYVQNSANM